MAGSSGAKVVSNKPAAANAPRSTLRTNPNRLAPERPRKGMPESVTCPSPQKAAQGAHEDRIRDPMTPTKPPKGSPTRSPHGAGQPRVSPRGSPKSSPTGAARPKGSPKASPKRSPKANTKWRCSSCQAYGAWEDVGSQQGGYYKFKPCKRYETLVSRGMTDATPETQEAWKKKTKEEPYTTEDYQENDGDE